jgi:alpha-ketoglutarate-dependent taurine dioxygenase
MRQQEGTDPSLTGKLFPPPPARPVSTAAPMQPLVVDAFDLPASRLGEALEQHRVVVLQGLADPARLRGLARIVSEAAGGTTEVEVVGAPPSRGRRWRSDLSFLETPPAIGAALLTTRAREAERTRWVDTVAGYERLPTRLRHVADQLRALHVYSLDHGRTTFQAIHPVVTVDPRSERRALFLGHDVRSFVGLSREASDELLRTLTKHLFDADHVTTIPWSNGDALVWDNTATAHETFDTVGGGWATTVTFPGRAPVGVDGSKSRRRHGDVQSLRTLVA